MLILFFCGNPVLPIKSSQLYVTRLGLLEFVPTRTKSNGGMFKSKIRTGNVAYFVIIKLLKQCLGTSYKSLSYFLGFTQLQCEWTPPQIFFYIYCISQLFYNSVEGPHDIKLSQKQLELRFCRFQRLSSNFTRGSYGRCSIKKGVLKNFKIFTGKHLYHSLFLSCNFVRDSVTGVFL